MEISKWLYFDPATEDYIYFDTEDEALHEFKENLKICKEINIPPNGIVLAEVKYIVKNNEIVKFNEEKS